MAGTMKNVKRLELRNASLEKENDILKEKLKEKSSNDNSVSQADLKKMQKNVLKIRESLQNIHQGLESIDKPWKKPP